MISLNKKQSVIATSFVLVLLAVTFIPISNQQSVREYDPRYDMNDDGKVDIKDLAYVARAFGTRRTPYPAGKIYFLMSPNPHAFFNPPPSKEADFMFIWVSVMKDSTYGRFTMALVAYESYDVEGHHYFEYHWFTDSLKGGQMYAYPIDQTSGGIPIVWNYDVSIASIDITMSEHQLNATVTVNDKTLFTVSFWANTDAPMESRISTSESHPPELYLSVEAYRPVLKASVTGIEVGDFTGGHFDYIDTELIDPSILP